MAGLKDFSGTPAEMNEMETKARARKAEDKAAMARSFAAKEAEWAKRPAPSTKLVAPAGPASGKSMKGFKPTAKPSLSLSRQAVSPNAQTNGAKAKARLDAMKKMAGR